MAQHPMKIRVKKQGLGVSSLTPRDWNPQFQDCSSLFFPIMPQAKVFLNNGLWPTLDDFNRFKPKGIRSWVGNEIIFILQKGNRRQKGFEGLYEPQIFLKGEIRTRLSNWHDFFNAQIWYTFPLSKSALNMRQFIAYDERADFPWKTPNRLRMREQDYMTMFDEGGCILAYCENERLPFLFGHAIFERLIFGDNDITMCCIPVLVEKFFFNLNTYNQTQLLDKKLAQLLSNRTLYYGKTPFFNFPLKIAASYLSIYKMNYLLNNY